MNAETNLRSVEPAYVSSPYTESADSTVARPTRVLVVDDDQSLQHMLVSYLEQHDMRVSSALHGQEARRQFVAERAERSNPRPSAWSGGWSRPVARNTVAFRRTCHHHNWPSTRRDRPRGRARTWR